MSPKLLAAEHVQLMIAAERLWSIILSSLIMTTVDVQYHYLWILIQFLAVITITSTHDNTILPLPVNTGRN